MPIGWVLKLGGSLWASDALPHWLNGLSQTPAVIVPGGGLFADAVRVTQRRWHFADAAAHDMAIAAMAQYGRLLCALCPALNPATGLAELAELATTGRPAVWLPDPEQLSASDLATDWTVSSDTLAAWLAEALGAAQLLLVKSADLPDCACEADTLVARGIIDAAFPEHTGGTARRIWLSGSRQHERLAEGLASPETVFIEVLPSRQVG
jgi:aspartokinase-like uncharacterized kinase